MRNRPDEIIAAGKVDQVRAWMLYCYFGGDTLKTASAVSCDESVIVSLAHDGRWLDLIKGRNRLDTDEGRKAEQEANRASNYVMAQRLGGLIESVVLQATQNPEEWAERNCVEVDDEGNKTFSTKPLVEIAKAAEIVQNMTYRALGDKMAGTASTTGASDGSVTNLMVNVYQGLDKLGKAAKQVHKATNEEAPIVAEIREVVG